MTHQQLMLGLIAIAILVVLLIPTLIIKTRKERKSLSLTGSAGESRPATRGRRFCALLIDALCVGALNGLGWGLFVGGTTVYELKDIAHKPAIESATTPIGTALLLAISFGYAIVSLVGRFGFSPGTDSMHLAWVDEDGRPSGRLHTLVIGAACRCSARHRSACSRRSAASSCLLRPSRCCGTSGASSPRACILISSTPAPSRHAGGDVVTQRSPIRSGRAIARSRPSPGYLHRFSPDEPSSAGSSC